MSTPLLTDAELAEIEARLAHLPPEPWTVRDSEHGPVTIYDSYGVGWLARVKESLPQKRETGAFIAAARQDVSRLLAMVRWLQVDAAACRCRTVREAERQVARSLARQRARAAEEES